MLAQRLEQLADEALWRPVREGDLSARFAHTHHLGGRLVLIGREHHAKRRHDKVEARIRKRQRLGIRLAELHAEALSRGALAPALASTTWKVFVGRFGIT